MKTAISIPDDIFQSAEQLARRLGVSRSELYVQALKSYLQEHHEEGVTDALNMIYGDIRAQLDPVLQRVQTHSLPQATGHDTWRHLVGGAA
jgi:metal-responsive CopG/Arc/MetJ family transcriptional regulator